MARHRLDVSLTARSAGAPAVGSLDHYGLEVWFHLAAAA